MDVLDLIATDNYICYNKELAKEFGIESAILFGAFCGYQRGFKNQEFFREQTKIIEDTCLTEYAIRQAVKVLSNAGLISVVKKGLPAKNYYKINTQKLLELLSTSSCENDTTSGFENSTTGNCENDTTIYKNNNIKINNKEKEIFDFWNSKNIIKHKELNATTIKAIQKALKEYTADVIKECISRYDKVIKDNNYYFDTRWSLCEFLKQKNAMPDFLDEGSKWLNYINRRKDPKILQQREYTQEDYDGVFDNFNNYIKNI